MKAIFWHDETMGAEYEVDEIPANLVEEAEEWRDKMLETLAEFDETLMEKYFDDPSTITVEEIKAAIRKATLAMEVNPMICGSSFKNKGVQTLLDAVCAYLPSPEDSGAVEGHAVDDPDEIESREPKPDAPMCALAFKIATDPYVGRLCFFRVYSGEIQSGSYVLNSRSGKKERISAFPDALQQAEPERGDRLRRHRRRSRLQGYPHGRHPLRREPSDRA